MSFTPSSLNSRRQQLNAVTSSSVMEDEVKISAVGIHPLFRIHSPARMCQPVGTVSSDPTLWSKRVVDYCIPAVGVAVARPNGDILRYEPHFSSRSRR
jgi:hypothetical protein